MRGPRRERVNVIVIDDEPAHRARCRALVDQHADLCWLGEARDGRRGIELAAEVRPDVIVLDLRMPVMDGMTALPHLVRAAPRAAIVIWSADDLLALEDAAELGVRHAVRKMAGTDALVDAIRDAASSGRSSVPEYWRRTMRLSSAT